MANSIWVMVLEKDLPTVATLSDAIASSEFPLTIDKDWEWRSHSGWLPMHWHGEESGCEVDFEPMDQGEIDAAAAKGFNHLDSVVVITTRGWESLKVGYAFIACLIEMTGGCFSEDDDELLGAKDALDRVRDGIKAAEQGERNEESRAAVNDLVRDDLEGYLKSVLANLSGRKIKEVLLVNNDHLVMYTDGPSISSNIWALHTPDRNYDITRFWWFKDLEHEMQFGNPTPEELDKLDEDLVLASRLDEADKSAAWSLLKKWAEDITIVEARWKEPYAIEVTLSVEGNPKLIFSGESEFQHVVVRDGLTEVYMSVVGLRLYESNRG